MRRLSWGSCGPSAPSRSRALLALLLHKANPLRAVPPPASDSVVGPVLLLILAHVPCLGEALKLAFGAVITVWTIIFAFEFLEICSISFLLACVLRRQSPALHIPQPPLAPTGNQDGTKE